MWQPHSRRAATAWGRPRTPPGNDGEARARGLRAGWPCRLSPRPSCTRLGPTRPPCFFLPLGKRPGSAQGPVRASCLRARPAFRRSGIPGAGPRWVGGPRIKAEG